MARDFIFVLKRGEPLPPTEPGTYRVIVVNETGELKLLNGLSRTLQDFSNVGTGASGGTEVTSLPYSSFYSLISGGGLTTGSWYIINDYKTCYDQPDYNVDGNAITSGIYKDNTDVQPIVLLATSTNTISEVAYQPAYPNDTIKYDWTFSATERTNGVAYGRITERVDEFNNRTDYDHRQVKFKRYRYYELELNNTYQGTVEVSIVSSTGMTVLGTGTSFLSNLGVGNKVGFGKNDNYRAFEVTSIISDTEMTITGLTNTSLGQGTKMYPADWSEYSSYYQNNVDDSSVFEEHYTFEGSGNYNNYIGNHANLYQTDENDFILANNVFHDNFKGNKFGDSCYNNTFFDDCSNNNVGNFFYNNVTDDDFDGNVIGNNFINNRITANFQYNRIGESFRDNYIVQNDFYRNNIMNDFRDNEISGGDFQNNEIGSQFNNNEIKEEFYKNDIGNGYNNNEIYWGAHGNLIGNGFANNNIYAALYDNTIGEYFNDNTIGDVLNPYSREFYENKIGVRFENNLITENFYRNNVENDFSNNQISGSTYSNTIGEQFENNTIYSDFSDNQIFHEFKGNIIYQQFTLNRVDWGFSANELSGYCSNNTFGSYTFSNDFLGSVVDNELKGNMYSNIIGDEFVNNSIDYNFNGNTLSQNFKNNKIGSNFVGNTIAEGFGFGNSNSQKNYIGDYFTNNIVGEYFYNNRVANYFTNNTLGEYFQWNIIDTNIDGADFTANYGNLVSFSYVTTVISATDGIFTAVQGSTNGNGTGASFDVGVLTGEVTGVTINAPGKLYSTSDTITILGSELGGSGDVVITVSGVTQTPAVYEPFTCQIFERKGGDKRLSYYDESDVLNITNINE